MQQYCQTCSVANTNYVLVNLSPSQLIMFFLISTIDYIKLQIVMLQGLFFLNLISEDLLSMPAVW